MSKITKENVLNAIKSIREKVNTINSGTYRDWQMLDNYIDQQEKQEKLLELYKKLSDIYKKLYSMELSELALNHKYYKLEIIKIKAQIKELESE